ncbi:MAG: aldehyde dehydrogenase family protein, partial [Microbacterium sp.]|nr:aldehyde dehydrogenase family protein [Microbacterium sp.]
MSDYAVVNPATGETLATYDTFTDAQVEAAVTAAASAYETWSETPVAERAALVRRVAELHRERRDELAAIIVREMGKPLSAALGEVDFAADITQFYADNAEKITADQPIDILGEGTAVIRKAPIGVLLGIMPWNFPYYQVARFAAPNLVLGNTILLKHAPQCPESSAAIEAMYRDAGLPAGAYVNLYITNDQAATIIADPRVQGVSVTGSERAGAAVAEVAGRNLKKVALELGGSDPFILLSTDDLDAAVAAAVEARLDNNGQSCNAPKRFIVVDELYQPFLEKFTAAMTGSKVGDPFADDTVVGPLSSLAAAERLAEQVDKAVQQGAQLVAGGTRDGAFYAPTVLTGVTSDMDVYREELFGPAGVVYKVADEDEAVKIANDTGYGLGSYVYTTDEEQAQRIA